MHDCSGYRNSSDYYREEYVRCFNTVSVRGKFRRQGRNNGGYSKSWKKAIITLKENSKPIEFFEGMM